MKKKITVAVIVIVVFCTPVLSAPLINNACAAANYERLTELPVPADTLCVETASYTGRLVGNGDGMQFFAAMLVESTQGLQELQAYYTPLDCTVQEQAGQTIDRIDKQHTQSGAGV